MTEYTVVFTLSKPVSNQTMYNMIALAIDAIDPEDIIESVTVL